MSYANGQGLFGSVSIIFFSSKQFFDNFINLFQTLLKRQFDERFEVCRSIEIGWNKDLFKFFNDYYNTSDWNDWILEEDWILKKDSSITFRAKDNNYLDFSWTFLNKTQNNTNIDVDYTDFNQSITDDFFANDIINDNFKALKVH